MAEEKIFADGFILKAKHENAPEWVLAKMSVKVEEAIAFLQQHNNKGWVNLDLLLSQAGKPYVALDTFTPKPPEERVEKAPSGVQATDNVDDLPF